MDKDLLNLGELYAATPRSSQKIVIEKSKDTPFDYFDSLQSFGVSSPYNNTSKKVESSIDSKFYVENLSKITVLPREIIEEVPVSRKDILRLEKSIEHNRRSVIRTTTGGGSVATQYQNGGIMDGNLIINGFLSAYNVIYPAQSGISPGSNVASLSGNWQNTYTSYSASSSNYNQVATSFRILSGNWQNAYNGYFNLSSNWQDTYTIVQANSSKWESVYSNVVQNSAFWSNQPLSSFTPLSSYNNLANIVNMLSNTNINTYVEVTVSAISANMNVKYKMNSSNRIMITLPLSAIMGQQIFIRGYGTGGWRLLQRANQIIHGSSDTTQGLSGYIESQARYDCVSVECIVPNMEYIIINQRGTLTVV